MNRKGFTLVEVVVVAVIFVVLSGGLLTTYLAGRTSYASADAFIQVQQESRRAFDTMVRELREAGNVAEDGADRLNFQIARGYNLDAVVCPNAICWGSDFANNEWVHYAVITVDNVPQLIRFTSGGQGTATPAACAAPTCRVLANYYFDDPADPDPLFDFNAVDQSVTIKLQIRYSNTVLPTGSMSSPTLTSRVTLRN